MSQQSLKQPLKFKFTEASVLAVSIPEKRERTYTDAHTQGLALRVLNTSIRTYYARLWNPRTKTTSCIKIGDASVVSLRYARDMVCDLRQAQEERRHRPAERVCVLSDVFEAFIVERRARGCTEGYIGQNQRAWQQVPSELRGRELDEIVANGFGSADPDTQEDAPRQRSASAPTVKGLVEALNDQQVVQVQCSA